MPEKYNQSIFAHELENILKAHSKDLNHLKRVPLVFDAKKVDRLIASLHGVKPLATLNQVEIIELVRQLNLDGEEYLRLYAALVALGVQRLMLDYLAADSAERAWKIADEVRQVVLEAERKNPRLSHDFLTRHILPQQEAASATQATSAAGGEIDPLAQALDSYDEGVALATLGQLNADVVDGRNLLSHARVCLQQAAELLQRLSRSVQETEDWKYWSSEVQRQLLVVEDELE